MKRQTIRTVAFWTATILGPASFVIGGVLNLSQSQQVAETMHHLGYPVYFASILGSGSWRAPSPSSYRASRV